jgi:OmpA family protein
MANPIFILDIDETGVVAVHPNRVELPMLVAPTPEDQRNKFFNTVRPSLITIGCMNLSDRGFDFDSSFIVPRAKKKFVQFAELMLKLQQDDPQKEFRFPPISIFGHADPTGTLRYNKFLSGRRAQAVFALLTRNVDMWEKLFSHRGEVVGDVWGIRSIQHMLSMVPPALPLLLDPEPSGLDDEKTRKAVTEFQNLRDIKPATGRAHTADAIAVKTRRKLFEEYMNAICAESSGLPFKLKPERDFLCRGKDPAKAGKGDFQGCGEFNPILLLPAGSEKGLEKEERDTRNAPNRRVLVYIFNHGSEINPKKWPCPTVDEKPELCRPRFWSDGETVRSKPGPKTRCFKNDRNTFACRWYQGFAHYSPCELGGLRLWVIRLRVDGMKGKPEPLVDRAWVVKAGENEHAPLFRGVTDQNGDIRIPVFEENVQMLLKVDFFGTLQPRPPFNSGTSPTGADTDSFPGEDDFLEIKLNCGQLLKADTGDPAIGQRLLNLGLGSGDPKDINAVSSFQRIYGKDHGLAVTGDLDDKTRDAIRKEHEEL